MYWLNSYPNQVWCNFAKNRLKHGPTILLFLLLTVEVETISQYWFNQRSDNDNTDKLIETLQVNHDDMLELYTPNIIYSSYI